MGRGLVADQARSWCLSHHEHHADQSLALRWDVQRRSLADPWVHLLLWIFATPALVILGEPYLRETWAPGDTGRVTSSALVVIGVGAAYAYSVFATIEQSDQVYFDTATMVLMLFTIGSYIEAAGRAKAARDLEPLLAAESESATVVEGGRDYPPGAGASLPACWCASGRASAFQSMAWSLRASRTPMRP